MNIRVLFAFLSILVVSSTHAYTTIVSVPLDISRLHEQTEAIRVSCTLSSALHRDREGHAYLPVLNGSVQGAIEIEFDLDKPLIDYEDVSCDIDLCRALNDSLSCHVPSTGGPQFSRYNTDVPQRFISAQPLAETLVLHTPPPSYQMHAQQSSSTGGGASSTGSSGAKSAAQGSAKTKSINSRFGSAAGEANTQLGYVELGLAIGSAVASKNIGALSKALADAAMGATSVATNAAFNEADSEGAIGVVGDVAGIGLGIAGAAISGTAAVSAGAVMPLLGALSGGMSLGSKINKKLDEEFDEPIQRALDALFPNYINRGGYDESSSSNGSNQNQSGAPNSGNAQSGVRAQDAMQLAAINSGGFQRGKADKGDGKGTGSGAGTGTGSGAGSGSGGTGAATGSGGSGPAPGSGGEAETPTGGSQPQGGTNAEETPINGNQTANHATGHVSSSETNSDGSYSYVVVVTDSNGNFVSGSVTRCSGGTCTDTYFGVDGQPTGETRTYPDNRGSAPENGEHDVWVADGEDSGEEGSTEQEGETKGDQECQQGQEGCATESEPEEEESTETTPEEEKKADSTPDPRDRDNMSEGIAWAMQNPDNPMAHQILAQAARSISDLSGSCKGGCPEAKSEGGILWAMLNPDHPLAQQILAEAAEAISDNSGDGQTGGPDDNPANEMGGTQASERELQQIEFLISGGGVSDPPEAGGSGGSGSGPAPDGSPLGGPEPIGGGGTVKHANTTEQNLEVRGGRQLGGSGTGGDDPDGGPDTDIRVNASKLSSGGTR